MLTDILFNFYLAVLFVSSSFGIYFYKKLDANTKIIAILLIFTLVSELASSLLQINGFTKTPPYHIFNAIEFICFSLYFLRTIFPKKLQSIYPISAVIIFLSFLNTTFLQSFMKLNSNFILLENFCVIPMALYALYSILVNESIISVLTYAQFWFWVIFLTYSSSTFFFWGFIKILYKQSKPYLYPILYAQEIINILVYASIGVIFLFYAKRKLN